MFIVKIPVTVLDDRTDDSLTSQRYIEIPVDSVKSKSQAVAAFTEALTCLINSNNLSALTYYGSEDM